MYRREFLYLSVTAAAGCTPAATVIAPPEVIAPDAPRFAGDTGPSGTPMRSARWWESLGSGTLNSLVRQLETGNPDLAAAALRVVQNELNFLNANAKRLPTATLSGSSSATNAADPQGTRNTATSIGLAASATWEADIVGKIAAEGDAAAATLLASRESRDALANTLIAALIRNFINVAFDKRQIAATRLVIASRESTLDITRQRFSRGVGGSGAGNVLSAEESLAAARADLPQHRLALARNINALDVTLGRLPVSRDRYAISLPEAPPARKGAVGLPADLLRRRPDIRMAEANLTAANANIRLSVADRFPALKLGLTLQSNGASLSDILDVDTIIASLVADLMQTIFDGKRGSRIIALREAQARELAQSYVSAVLTAVSEVENALAAETYLARQAALLRSRRSAARKATSNARARYQEGTGSYLTLLDASRSQVNAQNAYLNVQRARWSARVDLMLALGGSWTEGKS